MDAGREIAEKILSEVSPELATKWRQHQACLALLPANIGKARAEGRLTYRQEDALVTVNVIEADCHAALDALTQRINAALATYRAERAAENRKAGLAEIERHGLRVGQKVYRIQQHMLALCARRIEGVVKIAKDGTAYVSSPVQRGRLILNGWRAVEVETLALQA